MNKTKLQRELLAVGAGPNEARELVHLASQLPKLRLRATAPNANPRLWLQTTGTFAAIGAIVAAFIMAQNSLPGSWLYSLKRVSENTVATINPDYQGTIMMRRAQEVSELVTAHAPESTVLTTLQQYQQVASSYKDANQAAIAYCKHHLETAQTNATPAERYAISQTLHDVEST